MFELLCSRFTKEEEIHRKDLLVDKRDRKLENSQCMREKMETIKGKKNELLLKFKQKKNN